MTRTPELLTRITSALRQDYVFGEKAAAATDALTRWGAQVPLPDLDPETLSVRLTEVLQAATSDLHLRLIHHPGGAPDPADSTAYEKRLALDAAASAGGVRSVERLPGGVAHVRLGPFIASPVHAASWQTAAMDLCAGATAVVLDVRECRGGTPDGVALVCSYLFDPEPVHLTTIEDRRGARQFWTFPVLPGRRLGPDVPAAVLVSAGTFSGGEQLAFDLQELGRAVVVGERTRGGAHPRIGVKIADELELAVPVAVPRSPRTGRNWEGAGVRPDIASDAARALDVACEALRRP